MLDEKERDDESQDHTTKSGEGHKKYDGGTTTSDPIEPPPVPGQTPGPPADPPPGSSEGN